MFGWRLIQVVPAFLFATCFLCIPAVGMDLADLQPGITTNDAIEGWLEKATRNAISGSLRIRTFSSNDEGLEELTAWFDESRLLQWARVRLTQTLPPRSAALLFDLYGQVTVAQGDSFATPGTEASGSTHHYAADGVHLTIEGDAVTAIWLTTSQADLADIRDAVGRPANEVTPDQLWPGTSSGSSQLGNTTGGGTGGSQEPPDGGGRASLGAVMCTLNTEIALNLELPSPYGVVVLGLRADGPADRAGLMPEDVIVRLNRRRVDSAETLRGFLKGLKPGVSVRLGILRDGATETVEVTLAATRSLPASGWGGQWPSWLGVSAETAKPEMAWQRQNRGAYGVRVLAVHPEGSAAGRLRRGDRIVEYEGWPVRDSLSLARQVARTRPGTEVELRVVRGTREETITISVQAVAEANGGRLCPPVAVPEWGLVVRGLNRATAKEVRTQETHGLHIDRILPGSPAAEAGLQSGDVILQIGGFPALDPRLLERRAPEFEVRLTGRRAGAPFISVLTQPPSQWESEPFDDDFEFPPAPRKRRR